MVTKKTDKTSLRVNDNLNVTLTLENIGDFPVGINVTDTLPKNALQIPAFSNGTIGTKACLQCHAEIKSDKNWGKRLAHFNTLLKNQQ